ncbi:MAG: FtsX-like permease family protein, partial [Thermoanaerobaculia bacterium]|nr:FtsX-like permease family protein [Thermoanaerobaculia bacterium]
MSLRWWRLAARNLFRHRRRTILTGSIVVVGFVAATMTAGFVAQTFRGLKDITIRGQGGHLRVVSAEATGKSDEEAATLLLDGAVELTRSVATSPDVKQAMPRLAFFGLVARGERSIGYMGTGTVPALEKSATITAEAVAEGEFLADPEADEVMLGGGLARSLGAGVGDLVTVMTTTPDGALNAIDATVVDRLLFLPYAPAARLLKAEGKATSIAVTLKPGADLEKSAGALRARLHRGGVAASVRTWVESAPFYVAVRRLYAGIFLFTGLVLATVVILAAANTMTMSVFERTREIGTLLAIGMERRQVRNLFLAEGLLMGLGGSIAGAVGSLLIRAVLNASRISLPPPPGATSGGVLNVELIPEAFVVGFLLMTITLLAASWWPARRAARLDPVE